MRRRKPSGFTLLEVLIALALLGIIAAFAIPKVLQRIEDSRNQAILKETKAALSDIFYELHITNDLGNYSVDSLDRKPIFPVLQGKLNALKACPHGTLADGCRTLPYTIPTSTHEAGGFILPSGATLTVYESGQLDIILDANGDGLPNQVGSDQLYLVACALPSGSLNSWCRTCGLKNGMVGAPTCIDSWGTGFSASNLRLYQGLGQ